MPSLARHLSLAIAALTVSALGGCEGSGTASVPWTLAGPTMGTRFSVKVAELAETVDTEELARSIRSTLDRINALMSTYDASSELSRFNDLGHGESATLSAETTEVLAAALRIHELTRGAFDPTVGPAVNAWGFGPGGGDDVVPGEEELRPIRESVGFHRVQLVAAESRLTKLDAGVKLDLSAIAKGYAVDQVADVLRQAGAENFMIEVGGEIRCQGEKEPGRPWVVAIETPTPGRRGVQPGAVFGLRGRSLATSGDYRNFFERDGVRYSHTIDPRTCRPVTHELRSVSVVASTCAEADGLATGLLVLGPDEGFVLATNLDLAAYFIVVGPDGPRVRATPRMEALLRSPGT